MCWQIELDRVVTGSRDFVWLRPVIQTHDSWGMSRSFWWLVPTRGSDQPSPITRFLGSSDPRVIQLTARRITPNETDSPENAIRHTTREGWALRMFRSGCVIGAMPVQMAIA